MSKNIKPVELKTVKDYLRVDFDEDDTIIEMLIESADRWICGAVGEQYDRTDKRAELLALLLISDMYDNRTMSEKTGTNARKLIDDICTQLRLELRKVVPV